MLIDLNSRFVINPALYGSTLAIRLGTDNRPECGVFAGQHIGFTGDEENQRVPRLRLIDESPMTATVDYDTLGHYDFVVDRPESRARSHERLSYHYVVVGWNEGVYIQHQNIWTLTLLETSERWHVSIGRPGWMGLDLVLPDYQPGWMQRSGRRGV